jgi:hypothetical protein
MPMKQQAPLSRCAARPAIAGTENVHAFGHVYATNGWTNVLLMM